MKRRILVSKLLTLSILALAIVSYHIWDENSLMDTAQEITGYIALVIATMGRVWTSAYISGKKNKLLVTYGPFSIVRNPLYFFTFMGFVGTGLALESIAITLGMVLVFFVTHWPAILAEEKRLREIFGKQFDRYAKTVPRFIPKPWKLVNPQEVSFTPAIFSRAVRDCSLIAIVYGLSQIVEWAHLNHMLPILFLVP